MKYRALTIAVALASTSQAFAGSPTFVDARAFAMGGVGVASARPAAASFYNPALLAVKQKEKADGLGVLFPSVYAMANDEDKLRDEIDDFDEEILNPFEDSIDAIENYSGSDANEARALAQDVIDNTGALDSKLNELNQDTALIDVGAGVSVQIPSQGFAFGVFISSNARISATIGYADSDLLNDYITDIEDVLYINGDPDDGFRSDIDTLARVAALDVEYNDGDLRSSVRAVGASTTQAGVSLAHSFELGGQNIAVGVSPKVVDYRVYDITADVDDFEFDDLEDYETSETAFNFDIGLAAHLDAEHEWLVGLSVLNVIEQELESVGGVVSGNGSYPDIVVDGVNVKLEPTVTAGIGYSGDSLTIAADLQLTEQEGFYNSDDFQMIGVGMEYDLFETMQLRAGARQNIASDDADPIFTAGLGFTVFGAAIELAAAANEDTAGASFQIGSTF